MAIFSTKHFERGIFCLDFKSERSWCVPGKAAIRTWFSNWQLMFCLFALGGGRRSDQKSSDFRPQGTSVPFLYKFVQHPPLDTLTCKKTTCKRPKTWGVACVSCSATLSGRVLRVTGFTWGCGLQRPGRSPCFSVPWGPLPTFFCSVGTSASYYNGPWYNDNWIF